VAFSAVLIEKIPLLICLGHGLINMGRLGPGLTCRKRVK
jgi:hypothetical protein